MKMLELLSRHWAVTSINPGTGRGGVPELTGPDIDFALGCVTNKMARDLVLVVRNIDGVTRALRNDVEAAFRSTLVREHAGRARELVAARLELHLTECEYEGVNNLSLRHKALRSYQAAVERCKLRQWPWDPNTYRRVFTACALEVRSPRTCPDCNGRASVMIEERKVECPGCMGLGKKPYKKCDRAAALGVTYPAYREGWHKVYEWAFGEMMAAEYATKNDLVILLSREPVAA